MYVYIYIYAYVYMHIYVWVGGCVCVSGSPIRSSFPTPNGRCRRCYGSATTLYIYI